MSAKPASQSSAQANAQFMQELATRQKTLAADASGPEKAKLTQLAQHTQDTADKDRAIAHAPAAANDAGRPTQSEPAHPSTATGAASNEASPSLDAHGREAIQTNIGKLAQDGQQARQAFDNAPDEAARGDASTQARRVRSELQSVAGQLGEQQAQATAQLNAGVTQLTASSNLHWASAQLQRTQGALANTAPAANYPADDQKGGGFWDTVGEGAGQVGGFFKGIGETGVEAAEGLGKLALGTGETVYDVAGGPLVDLGILGYRGITGQEMDMFAVDKPAWLPDAGRGVERVVNAGEAVGSLAKDPGQVVDGFVDPIKEDWDKGNYGEAIGRGIGEAAELALGAKGTTKGAAALNRKVELHGLDPMSTEARRLRTALPKEQSFRSDPIGRAADRENGARAYGRFIVNPNAQKLTDMLTDAGRIGGEDTTDQFIYVINQQHEIIIAPLDSSGPYIHPTLMGGRNPKVVAAGEVTIQEGQLRRVDNGSGHYAPSDESLRVAEKQFRANLPDSAFAPDFQGFLPRFG